MKSGASDTKLGNASEIESREWQMGNSFTGLTHSYNQDPVPFFTAYSTNYSSFLRIA